MFSCTPSEISVTMVNPASTADSANSTGYGPRKRIYFDGDESKYELFEVKFLGYLRLQNLHKVIEDDNPDADKNACIFAELTMALDDKSLFLIMRDAKDDGKKALQVLRERYLGKSKPRIISLYGQLASLKMNVDETTTEYILRAEAAATHLKTAREKISDSLLVAMCLRGLPPKFNAFVTVINQKDEDADFIKFKAALRCYEESENSRTTHQSEEHAVMKAAPVVCFACSQAGHKAFQCPNKERGRGRGHHGRGGLRGRGNRYGNRGSMQNTAKSFDQFDDDHSFSFMTSEVSSDNLHNFNECLLVDSGASSHVINSESKFLKFDKNFDPSSHYIELADNSISNDVVKGRGDAQMKITDEFGVERNITLHDALFIPSYKQNIFSVRAATERGALINFSSDRSELFASDGTKFEIVRRGKLYYLNNMKEKKTLPKILLEWHKIFGHCNVADILRMENIVTGMKITDKEAARNFQCDICVHSPGKIPTHDIMLSVCQTWRLNS